MLRDCWYPVPTAIEEQLLLGTMPIDFPDEFKSDFSSVLTSGKLIGSVGELNLSMLFLIVSLSKVN